MIPFTNRIAFLFVCELASRVPIPLVPLQVANDESEGVLLTNERYDVTEGRRSGLELSPSLRRLLAVYLF
jgi:hypothetical protein